MTQDIYGWHIIHTATGIGYGFCCASAVTEEDLWRDFDPDEFTLVPLVVAGGHQ